MRNVAISGFTIVFLSGPIAFADENAPLDKLYVCSAIEDDAERLSCYDEAVGRVKEAETAGEFATITRQEAEDVQRDAFGFSMPSLPRLSLPTFGGDTDVKTDDEGNLAELEVAIRSVDTGPYGKLIITFENGQVWQQSDSDSIRVSRKSPPTMAVIKRAAFGSFLIRLDTGQRFKAKRVE